MTETWTPKIYRPYGTDAHTYSRAFSTRLNMCPGSHKQLRHEAQISRLLGYRVSRGSPAKTGPPQRTYMDCMHAIGPLWISLTAVDPDLMAHNISVRKPDAYPG